MPEGRRHRPRKPARRKSFLDPKPHILIVCEGEVTEKQYLLGFERSCRSSSLRIEISQQHGVPRTLVDTAKRWKKEAEQRAKNESNDYLTYDSVWCVFDIDEHPNVDDAKQVARANDVRLAISNPCFELWLLLHFRGSPGMQHRHHVQGMLASYVPTYDKSIDFKRFFEATWETAAKRAEEMDHAATASRNPGMNPTTGVYKLLRRIENKKTEKRKPVRRRHGN